MKITTQKDFDNKVKEAIKLIRDGVEQLDQLSEFESSPTTAQFKQIKKLHSRLGFHVWA